MQGKVTQAVTYNLNRIVVLPPFQRSGYGSFLIHFSKCIVYTVSLTVDPADVSRLIQSAVPKLPFAQGRAAFSLLLMLDFCTNLNTVSRFFDA